jgi:ABC-2 type transport system permease protein
LSNVLLKVSSLMMIIGVATVFLMTFGITALGVGMGAAFPRFRYENVAQIPTGFGGIAYMIVTMLFIGAVITLEAWPVYRIFLVQALGAGMGPTKWAWIVLTFLLVIALIVFTVILPMKIGLKRLLDREI